MTESNEIVELLSRALGYVVENIEQDETLTHFGVKGMKWGVRKGEGSSYRDRMHQESPGALRTEVTTKYGERISVVKAKPALPGVGLNKLLRKDPANTLSVMEIRDSSNKKVGSFQAWRDSEYPKTIRGEWLNVNKDSQGRGYSKAAIDGLMKAAREDPRIDNVRLQVPVEAAPAKHIYSQLGFKKDKDLGDGLEDWVADVKTKELAHMDTDDFLAHYGVPGMKWGRRKNASGGYTGTPRVQSRDGSARAKRARAVKNRRALSDKDLDQLIQRLDKEKKLKQLVKEDLSPGRTATQTLLKNAGTKVAGTVVAGTAMYVVRGALTKQWGLGELASNIPKLKK